MRASAITLLSCLVLTPAVAGANVARGGSYLPRLEGDWLPLGLVLGGSNHDDQDGGTLFGAEASLTRLDRFFWGGWVDAVYDVVPRSFRFGIGPEIGWSILGVDGGFVGQVEHGAFRPGIAARLFLSFGSFGGFVRHEWLFGDGEDDRILELGFFLKLLVGLTRERTPDALAPAPTVGGDPKSWRARPEPSPAPAAPAQIEPPPTRFAAPPPPAP